MSKLKTKPRLTAVAVASGPRPMHAVFVTPAIATDWLNTKNNANRKMRPGVAEKYADDMRSGRWTQCNDPIQFYTDGNLASGQHRLWAIVESGIGQWFYVAYNLERKDGVNLDTGAVRSAVDNARISGDDSISKALISAAKGIVLGSSRLKLREAMSTGRTMEVVNTHREAAEWAACHVRRTRNLGGSTVLGAVGRAYLAGVDKTKLARFCTVLGNGFADGDKESAAIAIRNYLMKHGSAANSAAEWNSTFLKVQNAIKHFVAGTKLTNIMPVHEESYPLQEVDA